MLKCLHVSVSHQLYDIWYSTKTGNWFVHEYGSQCCDQQSMWWVGARSTFLWSLSWEQHLILRLPLHSSDHIKFSKRTEKHLIFHSFYDHIAYDPWSTGLSYMNIKHSCHWVKFDNRRAVILEFSEFLWSLTRPELWI